MPANVPGASPPTGSRLIRLPISLKITLPYAGLALLFLLAASFIVTTLVFANVQQRETNQLLASAQIASDLMVSKENDLLAVLRSVIYTTGVAEELAAGDSESLRELALPLAANAGVAVDAVDPSGLGVLSLIPQPGGGPDAYQFGRASRVYQTWPFVVRALQQQVDLNNNQPSNKFGGWVTAPWGDYFYVAGPAYTQDGRFAGAILVGISLDALVQEFERQIDARAFTFYALDGRPIRSTYSLFESESTLPPDLAQAVLSSQGQEAVIRPISVGSVAFDEVLGVWQGRNGEDQGIFGIARARQSSITTGQASRPLIFGAILALFLFVIFVGASVARQITRPITRVVDGITRLDQGDYSVQIPADSQDEIAVLANAFNEMAGGLRDKVRMEGDLNFARQIQMSLLPQKFPPFPDRIEIDVFAALQPAREVGGDFYDFFFLDQNRLFFVIGDVSGKTAAAALFMAVAKTMIKSWAMNEPSPARIVMNVNSDLARENKKVMFVTLFLGILDVATGDLVYTNAAHNPPFIRSRDGAVVQLDKRHGPVVGPKGGLAYGEARLRLAPGDILFMYTDGVTEAMNADRELYSEERLAELLSLRGGSLPNGMIRQVMTEVQEYMGEADQADDITVLAVQYRGLEGEIDRLELSLPNQLEEIGRAIAAFEEFTSLRQIASNVRRECSIALDEFLNNAISYGYPAGGQHQIQLRVELHERTLSIELSDDGTPFNPFELQAPDTSLELDARPVGGLGIHLVRSLMSRVSYRRVDNRNVILLERDLDTGQ